MSLPEYENIQLSVELIRLLQWMLEHEHDTLKEIIARAKAKHSTQSLLEALQNPIFNSEESIKEHIIHFFSSLDALIAESSEEEQESKQIMHRFLVPSLKQIDSSICDIDTINRSAEQARNAIETGIASNSKEALCREIMKQWNPNNSKTQRH